MLICSMFSYAYYFLRIIKVDWVLELLFLSFLYFNQLLFHEFFILFQ